MKGIKALDIFTILREGVGVRMKRIAKNIFDIYSINTLLFMLKNQIKGDNF